MYLRWELLHLAVGSNPAKGKEWWGKKRATQLKMLP